MTKTTGRSRVDTVFVLLIFSVFALSVLMVLMLGARIYKNMSDIAGAGQDERTILSYLWTKAKNGDFDGNITVGEYSGISAIYFDEEYDGVAYHTVIYLHEGWVYELYCEKSLEFLPGDGTQIIQLDELQFQTDRYGLIKVTANDASLYISERSEQ